MGKFDLIDIIFISLISFYLLVFTTIFVLLLRKHRGLKGFFRYLFKVNEDNEIKEPLLNSDAKDNKVTISEYFDKHKDDIKEVVSSIIKEEENKPVVKKKASSTKKKPSTTVSKKKTTTAKKSTTSTKKTAPGAKKTSTSTKAKSTTAKKSATTKKTTSTPKKKTTTKKTTTTKKSNKK